MRHTLLLLLLTACNPMIDAEPVAVKAPAAPVDAPSPEIIPEESPEEPVEELVDVTVSVTVGEPLGWISVRLIGFDGHGQTVSEWMDGDGYPGEIPTVIVVSAEGGDVWGSGGWRVVKDRVVGRDRLFAVGSISDEVDGDALDEDAISDAVSEISLAAPVFEDVVVESFAGESLEIVGPVVPGGSFQVSLSEGDFVAGVVDGFYGDLSFGVY